MISKVKISALKSIDHLSLDCAKLNVLTGTNSSGKSTFLQALLLVNQNAEKWHGLNGRLVSLGDFRLDAKNFNISADEIVIEIETQPASAVPIKMTFKEENSQSDESLIGKWAKTIEMNSSKGIFPRKILDTIPSFSTKYLSCNRISGQDVYQKNYGQIDDIGINGEYALFYLQMHKSKRLDSALIYDSSSETLMAQVNYWLNYIVGTTISLEDIPGTDIVKASYDIGDDRKIRPRNVGSGTSYLISLLVLCLSSSKDDILIIENPEIHLHPRAQSRICEFLYFISQANRQLFIETHSDHIFNGIRVGIATKSMTAEDVAVNFFSLDERHCTQVTKIEFGKNGRVLNYTEGLFDQFDIDLDRMLQI